MSADAITARAVRLALRQLWSDRTSPDGPLTDLALVARCLERHGSPISRSSRQWALGHVLSEAVEAELARRRGGVDATLDPSAAPASSRRTADPTAALERVRLDFRADDPALEGCSAVYHLYLRPDLGLSTSRLAALVSGRHPRTVQRRLGLGLEIIAHRLRGLEAGAAAERRREQLRHRLPVPAGGQAFGVERITEQLGAWWAEDGRAPVLVLTGPGGSGKSTAAAAFVRQLLDGDSAPHVAWLRACDRRERRGRTVADTAAIVDRPRAQPAVREEGPTGRWATALAREDLRVTRSGRHVDGPSTYGGTSSNSRRSRRDDPSHDGGTAALDTAFPAGRTAAAGRAVLAACRALGANAATLVVVDGVDDAREMWAVTRAVARAGNGPRWLVTSRLGWGAFPSAETVPLPALDTHAALALLRHECRRRALYGVAAASDSALDALGVAAAGHPAALLLTASELRAAPIATVAERLRAGTGRVGDLYERIWAGAWQAAPPAVRRVVEAVAAMERAGRAADPGAIGAAITPAGGWTGDDVEAALRAALDLGLLVPADGDAVCFRTPAFLSIWRAGA